MVEKEWKLVEEEFDKYGYSHVFEEMRLILYLRLNEKDGWFNVSVLSEALEGYASSKTKTFTFKQLEYEYDVPWEKVKG